MSYSPFMGGKRICLGKTFAENMAKCLLAIILSQVKFEFVDKLHQEKKPMFVFSIEESPTILVNVKKTY